MRFELARFIALSALSLMLSGQPVAAREEPSDRGLPKAIYWFQKAWGTTGETYEGTVAWSEASHEGAPAIQAVVRLPEKRVRITVTIYRNANRELPASHMIEIAFAGDLASSSIRRVPGIVRKVTEDALGEKLVAAAVPVRDHLFWIALSGGSEETEAENLQLLRYGFWFDLPILFRDGSRALLTFERGEAGAEIFEAVMSAWESR